MRSVLPVLTVLAVIMGIWYLAVAPMNVRVALDQAERAGEVVVPEGSVPRREVSVWRLMMNNSDHVGLGYALERPRLPTPAQVGQELWKTTGAMIVKGRPWSKRGLIYHGWITLQSTLWGFALGTLLGILGAVAIVYSRTAQLSLMPWAIISQTIPIVALAPMIIVLSSQVGIEERGVPKAIISAYLCFFPVLVGMVKGLRAPDTSQLDLLRTYNASGFQSFVRLRLPASVPYLVHFAQGRYRCGAGRHNRGGTAHGGHQRARGAHPDWRPIWHTAGHLVSAVCGCRSGWRSGDAA